MDFCVVTLSDGSTEELEYDALRSWLLDRGANPETVDAQVLEKVWSWPRAVHVCIQNPKTPTPVKNKVTPYLE